MLLLSRCQVILGFLALVYCKKVFFDAAEACYVIPCYEGPGLQALWKVNKGVTFTGESSGVFAWGHAILGYLLFAYADTEPHSFLVGIFAGCTFCSVLLSLNMVWFWGAEWNLLGDMTLLRPNGAIFYESGRHMVVNKPLISAFRQLFYLSATMGLLQGFVLLRLLLDRSNFIRQFRLLYSDARDDTGMESAGATTTRNALDEMTPLQLRYSDGPTQ